MPRSGGLVLALSPRMRSWPRDERRTPALRTGVRECNVDATGTHSKALRGDGMHRTFADLGPAQRRFMLRAMNEGVPLDDPLATRLIRDDKTRADLLRDAGLIHKRTSKKGRTSWRTTD